MTCASSTSVPTSGSPTAAAWRQYYGRAHARRHLDATGCPSCRGQRALSRRRRGWRTPAATRRRSPSLWPRCWPPGWSSRTDVVVVAASGTSGAGRKATDVAAGQRGHGRDVGVQGRRRAPAHARDGAGARRRPPGSRSRCRSRRCWPRCRAASWRRARPGSPAASAARILREALAAAYDDEPFVHVLADGVWPTTKADRSAPTSRACRSRSTRTPAGRWSSAALDNLVKGAAGQALQNANLMLGLPEGAGPAGRRGRTVSVTAPGRVPGGRCGGRSEDLRRPPTSRSSSTTVRFARRPPCSPRNRVKAAPVLWTEQVAQGRRRCGRCVLNSGGANACTGPDGFADTHRTPSTSPSCSAAAPARSPSARPG